MEPIEVFKTLKFMTCNATVDPRTLSLSFVLPSPEVNSFVLSHTPTMCYCRLKFS